ncbi:MAG: indole-3-glycerol phosphate synthase TrpC [Candidatus Rariloculaceae bacterium]
MNDDSFLGRMARRSRERVADARHLESDDDLRARAMATPSPPDLTLGEFDLIAELKLRSPAAGSLATSDFDRCSQLTAYAAGGAAAISVLTEPDEFKGDLAHLQEAASILQPQNTPTMRKDFITNPYQVYEARAAGAAGILVIVTMLSDEETETLLACAHECGLFVLLEAFDAQDLSRIATLTGPRQASENAPVLCGVNCRNLKTLAVDFDRFAALAEHLPAGLVAVAESGITGAEEVRAIAQMGYHAALVGSALMQSQQPQQAVAELIATGTAQYAE